MGFRTLQSTRYALILFVIVLVAGVVAQRSRMAAATALTFTNTPLVTPDGNSEPAITIAPNGTMALTGLSWLEFGTNLWTGPFG